VLALDDLKSADARADEDANAVGISGVIWRPDWAMASCTAAKAK
jgi:hypothetical protein